MAFIPVPATVEVELRYTYLGQKCENTLWFLATDPFGAAEMTQLGETVIDWWVANLAPITNLGVSLREVVVTDMSTATGPQVTVTTDLPQEGDVNEEALPSSTSLVASFRTGNRGRSFRGRNYFIGLSRTQYGGNQVFEAFADALVAAYEALLTAVEGIPWVWVVASRFSGVNPTTGRPIPRVAGITTLITTVVVTDLDIDNQRRRLTGRGN